jgi:putative membrane protein
VGGPDLGGHILPLVSHIDALVGPHLAWLADGDPPLPPFTGATAFTEWQPFQLLTIGLVAVAGLYLFGVWKLTRRGDKWPLSRMLLFLLGGMLPIAYVTIGGIGAYDDQLLSVHMVQHMVLGMIAPIFLALGAPITLALRTLPGRPRGWLVAALHSWPAKILAFPLFSFALYISTPFALYFSGLYKLTLEHEWIHNLTHVHFIVVGCLFFWPLIGLDPLPGRWPYPARALLMLVSTPFHAVLGLTIMDSHTLIGGSYYPSLHLAGVNAFSDQQVAGGILWAGGEVVSVTMLAALVVQWIRANEKETRRVDRQLDRAEGRRRGIARAALAAGPAAEGAAAIDDDGMTTPWWIQPAGATAEAGANKEADGAVDRPTATIVEQ